MLRFLYVGLMVASLILVGCGSKDEERSGDVALTPEQQKALQPGGDAAPGSTQTESQDK